MSAMEQAFDTERPTIAVVGLGPRGMILVERLIAQLRPLPDFPVDLLLFDDNPPGPGLHGLELPDYLLLNTVAGQLTFFPHPAAVGRTGAPGGPSLDEWCRSKGLRLTDDGVKVTSQGTEIKAGCFLPRRILGAYLADCARDLIDNAPAHVRLRVISEKVVDVGRLDDSGRHWLETAKGRRHRADHLFLSLGHGPAGWAQADIGPEAIRPGEAILLAGLGLTAMDMVSTLTKGRGGRFLRGTDDLQYRPSGREPRIRLSSATGLPFYARPDWSPEDALHRLPPFVFSPAAIDRLRSNRPGGRLDFRANILPLVALEMRAVYHVSSERLCRGRRSAALLEAQLREANGADGVASLLHRLDESVPEGFDPEIYLRTTPWQGDPQAYCRDYVNGLVRDLAECRRGVLGSPVKAALEVWRNERSTLRYAVDGTGLNEASRAEFYRVFAPLSNRLVGGPQKERHEELVALVAAGIVTLDPPTRGSGPADLNSSSAVRAAAHIGSSGLGRRDSPLLARLAGRGRLRPVDGERLDGIAVDIDGHPARLDGTADRTVTLVGPAVEGSSYYNHYVGTPAPDCPLFVDAERLVRRCLDQLVPASPRIAAACP